MQRRLSGYRHSLDGMFYVSYEKTVDPGCSVCSQAQATNRGIADALIAGNHGIAETERLGILLPSDRSKLIADSV